MDVPGSVNARASLSGFLKAIRPSGLVDEKTLEGAVAQFQSTPTADASTAGNQFGRYLVSQNLLTEWQCRNLLEGKSKGFFLGKYKLLRPIGAGGMSQVFLAEHIRMHRQVAIKVLSNKLTKEKSALERFMIEARAIATLDHPNIVHAYSVDSDGAHHYLVMQYIEGGDLERTVGVRGALPCEQAADYVAQAAEGLAHAHARGLVHRDIKPGNLLVDKTGVVKILDLGLALRVEATNSLTQVGGNSVMLGTTDFLAPEQALDSHNVDARCDIYSLGCTLYYLLAGHAPFPEGTMAERLVKHQSAEAPRLNRLRADVPADLGEICAKMMAKQPSDRYQTAHEVSAVLQNWIATHSRSPLENGSAHAVPQIAPEMAAQIAFAETTITRKDSTVFPPQPAPQEVVVDEDSSPSYEKDPGVLSIQSDTGGSYAAPVARTPGQGLSPMVLGGLAAGGLVAVLVLGIALFSLKKAPPTDAWVVLELPAKERAEAKVTLDGKPITIPPTGSIEIATHAGSRHLVLERRGFPAYERTITLEAGQRRNLAPWWGGTGDAPVAVASNTKPKTVVAAKPVAPPPNDVATTTRAGSTGGTSPSVPQPPVTQPPVAQQTPAQPAGPAVDPVFLVRPRPTAAPGPRAPLAPLDNGGVVSHIKVLSDKVPDVSSLDAWRRSYLTEGETPHDKALAIWKSVAQFQYFDGSPPEFIHHEVGVHDPIKLFNVYGYSSPAGHSTSMAALARAEGMPARTRNPVAHAITEIEYDGAWHLFDAGLIATYPKADGKLASMDEMTAGIQAWYTAHPDFKGNDAKLREFMANSNWKKGPEVLSRSTAFDQRGWMPNAQQSWSTIMQKFDGSQAGVYEHGYSMGYQVNVQLRPGERLVRNWSNRGLHVGMKDGNPPGAMDQPIRYAAAFGDLAPRRVGNGRLEYTVPLGSKSFRKAVLEIENLSPRDDRSNGPALTLENASQPGSFVLRMPSSYVYLTGQAQLTAVVGEGGSISASISLNNSLDWKPLAMYAKSGDHTLDLSDHVLRHYDYRLKFVLAGEGTALDKLEIGHDVQHSQRPLPALAQGKNQITFAAGPAEGTITLEGATMLGHRNKQLVYTDFHPILKNVESPHMNIPWGEGSVTFPVETPGDLVRLRFGSQYRARDVKEGWDYEVSYDDGKTFTKVDRAPGPTPGHCHYLETAGAVPPGVRKALVRFSGHTRVTTMLLNFRIDADYREPHGGFHPVKVTYAWEEGGQPKTDVHVAREADEKWEIECAAAPVMKSVTVELAE